MTDTERVLELLEEVRDEIRKSREASEKHYAAWKEYAVVQPRSWRPRVAFLLILLVLTMVHAGLVGWAVLESQRRMYDATGFDLEPVPDNSFNPIRPFGSVDPAAEAPEGE